MEGGSWGVRRGKVPEGGMGTEKPVLTPSIKLGKRESSGSRITALKACIRCKRIGCSSRIPQFTGWPWRSKKFDKSSLKGRSSASEQLGVRSGKRPASIYRIDLPQSAEPKLDEVRLQSGD